MAGLSEAVPQLPVTVRVCPVTVARFPYSLFNASAPNSQLATVNVNLCPTMLISERDRQLPNMVVYDEVLVAADAVSAGTD